MASSRAREIFRYSSMEGGHLPATGGARSFFGRSGPDPAATGTQFVAIVSIRMTNQGIASFGGSHMVVFPPSFSLCAPLPSRQHWPRGPSSRPDDLDGG